MGKNLMLTAILFSGCIFLMSSSSLTWVANATVPLNPGSILASPGDTVTITRYDSQSGPPGTRIVKDYLGGFHFPWMNGIDFWSGNRWVYYNFLDENGVWRWPKVGTQVNTTQGAGYPQIDVFGDGRAAVAYHSANNALYTCIGIDVFRGFGNFTELDVPEPAGPNHYYWPYETVDRQGRIHAVSTEYAGAGDPHRVSYARSHDEGYTWTDPIVWDTLMNISTVLTSSRVSDKVAIAFTHPRDLVDPDLYNNDMCYYESLDGEIWNFNGGMMNVTNYQTEDTIRAYYDCDAVYDREDNLHIIWNTPYYDEIGGHVSTDSCLVWHWSQQTGIILVADGSWSSYPPSGNLSVSKMNIAVDAENNLFAIWSQFDTLDVSAGGYSNGELYMSYSTDAGLTWREPENLTNSPTPGCQPEECDCDVWPSLAEEVDDYVHIVYINDKDAGVAPHQGDTTSNPQLYLKVENPAGQANVEEMKANHPTETSLLQNYPNPFNASTTISYQLSESGKARLDIYNLAGQLVETLVNSHQQAGYKTATWDGSQYSSGIYFCRLVVADFSEAKSIILVK